MLKLSKASKMPCRSWSLQALDTCPGSKAEDGGLVEVCQGCYATQGNYRFPNVKAPREHNRDDWKRTEWVDEMVSELDADRYFRWFDSGDMYDTRLAQKILEVMQRTPWVRHWLPTRMHKFPKFRGIIADMNALSNVVVRLSGDNIIRSGDALPDRIDAPISVVVSDPTVAGNATICEAYSRDGKCGSCRACWDKDNSVIAYPVHGKKMIRIAKG